MKKLYLIFWVSAIFAIEWTSVGPGGGGAMYTPSISPHNSNRIFISCDMSGLYKTTNMGNSWEMINFRQIKSSNNLPTLFHPTDSLIIWDEDYRDWTDNLRRSTDGGHTWESVWEFPDWISEIIVLPDEPLTILATLPDAGLYRSTNGIDFDLQIPANYGFLAWNNEGVYAGSEDELAFSNNRGISFNPIDITTPGYIDDLATGDGSIFILQDEYLYRSTNNGYSWEIVLESAPYERGNFRIIKAHGDHVWVTSQGGRQQPTVFLSTNNGDSFEEVFYCDNSWDDTSNLIRGWLSLDFVCGWGGAPDGFGISPTDPNIAVWTDNGRALATFDGGISWNSFYTNFADEGARSPDMTWSSRGLEVTSSWDIHISETEPGFMRIAYTDIQGTWSTDGGLSWYIGSDGIPGSWANTNYELVADNENELVWGSFSGLHDIIGGWSQNNWYQTGHGGVAFSDDEGRNWTPITEDLPDLPVTSIAIDNSSPTSSRTLYAAVWSNGVWLSTNGGNNWERCSDGLDCGDGSCLDDGPNTHIVQVEVHPDGTVFALKTKYIRSGSIIKNDGELYKSTDNGDSWNSISTYVENCTPVSWIDTEDEHSWADPISFTLDPEDVNHIWVCASNANNGKVQGGLYETFDGGENWTRILEIYAGFRLTQSIYVDSLLYLATKGNGVMYSTNNGITWFEDEQYPFSGATRITEDIYDDEIIWVNSFGGGVWKGLTSFTEVGEMEYQTTPSNFEINISPNPFNSSLKIELDNNTKQIKIYNLWGRKVLNGIVEKSSNSYYWHPNKSVESGLYFVEIEYHTGEKRSAKVMYIK